MEVVFMLCTLFFVFRSASKFDILAIRDLVGIVFGAIQKCSRQFRLSNGSNGSSSNSSGLQQTHRTATDHSAATYWIERLVYETFQGTALAGLWNFPATALVIVFYIYFVNRLYNFNK